ncbi:GNAT family N-acetyltransferase [Thalassospira sp. MA62]|nr:GNAT family N-acetyltransferase [Thalassospira sp. MA62]
MSDPAFSCDAPSRQASGGNKDGSDIVFEQLRFATDQDIATINRLWIANGLIPAIRDARQDINSCIGSDHGSLIVARAGNQPATPPVIATMMAGHDGIFGWVHYLAVDAEFQGKGIGKSLLSLGEDIMRATGIKELRVTIEKPQASDFYRNLGYDFVSDRADCPSGTGIATNTMRKRLDT